MPNGERPACDVVIDPVGAGYVESLARPGGNATGVSLLTASLTLKRLELIRELFAGAFCSFGRSPRMVDVACRDDVGW